MQFTRERILNILKEREQITVEELSRELGLTAVTVRHHLDILRRKTLVAPPLIRRRKTPGRPQYVYTLTDKASSFFPKRYEHLANLLLDEMRSHLSPAEIDQMMRHIGERIASQAALADEDDFEARLIATAGFLDELGYMTNWEQRDGGGYLLYIANCPYEQVSRQDHEVCTIDSTLLTCLLDVHPQRLSWVAQGDSQCTYVIHPPNE